MSTINIIIIILFIVNIVLPFTRKNSANPLSNGLGWGLATLFYINGIMKVQ